MAIDCNRKLSEPSEKRLTESQSASLAIGVALLIVIATVSYMGFRTHRSFFHDDAYITLCGTLNTGKPASARSGIRMNELKDIQASYISPYSH